MKKLLLLLAFILSFYSSKAQFFEGFENTGGPEAVPSTNWPLSSGNWAVFDNAVGQGVRWGIISTIAVPPIVYHGQNSAYVNREQIPQGSTSEDYLATPAINVPVNSTLKFYSRTIFNGNQGTLYQIKIAPASASQTNPAAYTLVAQFTESELNNTFNLYQAKYIDLSAYTGQQVYIAFVRVHTQSSTTLEGDRWYLDDVSITDLSECDLTNNCPNAIFLEAFIDSNNNGIRETNELWFNHGNFVYQVNDSGNNIYASTDYGMGLISVPDISNSYDISYVIDSDYSPYLSCNFSISNYTWNVNNNTLSFPVTVTAPFTDIDANIYSYQNPRAGFNHLVRVYCVNNGTSNISGTLTFNKDPNLQIISVTQPGTVSTPNGFTYDFTNLAPQTVLPFIVNLQVPPIPTVSIDQLITNSVSVQVAGDVLSNNNSASFSEFIVASYDPNDMMESHGDKIVLGDFTANDYLNYTIRFENTGTANAEFIRITDALDTQLDENTFELIGASHNVNALRNGNLITFKFNDINLPPSTINTDDGHGYVQFKIKPKPGYAIGDIIPNTASIYFDFNPAIVTNTFNTEFVNALSNPEFNLDDIVVYPNPASDFIKIQSLNNLIATVNIYDISGKRIYTSTENTTNEMNINVSDFAKGLYLLELSTTDNQKTTKKLIVK